MMPALSRAPASGKRGGVAEIPVSYLSPMLWTMHFLSLLLIGVALLTQGGCGRSQARAVHCIGSTSVQPFVELLAEEYQRSELNACVEVQGGGSTAGIQAVANGLADFGMCSRVLKDEERARFSAVVIAYDGLAVVVHPSNPVNDLSRAQLRQIFAGDVTNWKDVGGADRSIRVITREEGSGTREAFVKLVMGHARISRRALTQESNGAVMELVKHDPAAIGYASLGQVENEIHRIQARGDPPPLKAVSVEGVPPTTEAVKTRRYALVRPFLLVFRNEPPPPARRFLEFVLSARGQSLLVREGLVGVQ